MAGSPAVLELQRQINRFREELAFPAVPLTGVLNEAIGLLVAKILIAFPVVGLSTITLPLIAAAPADYADTLKQIADAGGSATQASAGRILPYQRVSDETLDVAAYVWNSTRAGIADATIVAALRTDRAVAKRLCYGGCSEAGIAAGFAYLADEANWRGGAFLPALDGPLNTARLNVQQNVDAVRSYLVNSDLAGRTLTVSILALRVGMEAQQKTGKPGTVGVWVTERTLAEALRQQLLAQPVVTPPPADKNPKPEMGKRPSAVLVIGLLVLAATAVVGGVVYARRRRRVDRNLVAAPAR